MHEDGHTMFGTTRKSWDGDNDANLGKTRKSQNDVDRQIGTEKCRQIMMMICLDS